MSTLDFTLLDRSTVGSEPLSTLLADADKQVDVGYSLCRVETASADYSGTSCEATRSPPEPSEEVSAWFKAVEP